MPIRFAFALVLTSLVTNSADADPSSKLTVPDDATQTQVVQLIRNLYKADYEAAKTPEQKNELAKTLLKAGIESKNDPTARYVLFRLARDIAAGAGTIETSMSAIDLLATDYDVDALAMRADLLTTVVKALRLPKERQEFAPILEKAIHDSIAQDRFDVAKSIHAMALASARQARSGDLLKQVAAQGKEIEELASEHARVKDALAKLDNSPIDPEANLLVGKYRCFVKNDWENGLPMLALGSDKTLKAIAAAELAEEGDALALGNTWWDYSDTVTGKFKTAVHERADRWYREALPKLEGLSKKLAESRIASIAATTRPRPIESPSTDKNVPRQVEQANWQSLLDAKALSGWRHKEKPSIWVNGANELVAKGDKSHIYYMAKQFSDFELELDVYYEAGGNGGVYVRCQPSEPGEYPEDGYEIQTQGVSPRNPTGTIFKALKASVVADAGVAQAGKWWKLKIVAQGDRIAVYADGHKVVDYQDIEKPFLSGYIALQSMTGVVHYRNIRIRPLK